MFSEEVYSGQPAKRPPSGGAKTGMSDHPMYRLEHLMGSAVHELRWIEWMEPSAVVPVHAQAVIREVHRRGCFSKRVYDDRLSANV